MSRRRLPQEVIDLARRQAGLVTRRQLESAGLTPGIVRRRIDDEWRLVLPGVVLLSKLDVTPGQRLVAAQLMAGTDAFVTGHAAVAWHGLGDAKRAGGPIHMLVEAHRAARSVGFVRVRRTHRQPLRIYRDGVVQPAPPARAIGDAVRDGMLVDEARALAIRAVQTRTVDLADLVHELHAGPRRGSALLRVAIDAAASGAWSLPEHDLLQLLATSKTLPRAWPNPALRTAAGARLPSPDAWFDDVGLAIQVHSAAHHGAGPEWDKTVRTDSTLAEAGILRIAVTPREIATSPRTVLARIEATYVSLSPVRRPPVRMTPRGPGLP